MIHIKEENVVKAELVSATEKVIPHYGLKVEALYQVADIPFKYKVTIWNRHAPVTMLAAVVSAKVADDAPLILLDDYAKPLRDENGRVKVTRTITVLCPISNLHEDVIIYSRGFGPLEVIQRYLNKYTLPSVFGSRGDLVQ